jgi:hypothetical protein
MSQFFENYNEAVRHLTSKGFRHIKTGRFVKAGGLVAHILLAPAGRVLVQTWEI